MGHADQRMRLGRVEDERLRPSDAISSQLEIVYRVGYRALSKGAVQESVNRVNLAEPPMANRFTRPDIGQI